jgi:hypothetical protein
MSQKGIKCILSSKQVRKRQDFTAKARGKLDEAAIS